MSQTPPPARKLPELEPDTAFYWTSGAEGVLRIQRCADCGIYQHPPFPRCSCCGSEAVAPAPVSGKGRIASYTINYEPWVPGLEVPFVFAAVELTEQRELYVFTNLLAPAEAARVGMAVTVEFEQHDDVWLPMFRPDAGEDAA
ncbi:Zn-ribbon domain-containing OB-fold protein [Novosphingobium album (ex Hu et al. 2023)]|uniref:OB-fold domain-containing protein n=1 Tax=Novosphingobium album (ex Hu et al. 2023) TaxID=2930093 RepID=A0ABT0B1R5_9SPHN|nr:OB-fold domain-containing protein [Novosphingobium album (ex Hu et al. 2023)]MCJ2178818.1 OB-fold domain-containing protein [Novosphingobium album (ex Hu et al. 2023)]